MPTLVWAGRPFFTDDAGLTTAGKCQVESWVQVNQSDTKDMWTVPACNPSGNFELSLGLNYFQVSQQEDVKSYLLQGKTLFRELEANSWGLGFAAGVIRSGQQSEGTDFAYFPLSISALDSDLMLHLNVGWLRDRTLSANRSTWGVGAEYALLPKAALFLEAFGDDAQKPLWHSGLNVALLPERIYLNLTYGRNLAFADDNRFYSIGLNFYSIPWR
ncbi:hypothetical protein [Methylotenera sp. 1P/1]|uniref:hypothetical protein n=1 Tax=Methylotenera sp. 1P/1 TaxID=1131551 RepID=UPI00036C7269|nr:hypothetical protein [Methylotenera sp. 1P/1]